MSSIAQSSAVSISSAISISIGPLRRVSLLISTLALEALPGFTAYPTYVGGAQVFLLASADRFLHDVLSTQKFSGGFMKVAKVKLLAIPVQS